VPGVRMPTFARVRIEAPDVGVGRVMSSRRRPFSDAEGPKT
jgi:hypothetical protein